MLHKACCDLPRKPGDAVADLNAEFLVELADHVDVPDMADTSWRYRPIHSSRMPRIIMKTANQYMVFMRQFNGFMEKNRLSL